MSVQQHCLSPLSDGLFQKAVMSSGGGVSKLMSAPAPEKHYDFWHAVKKNARQGFFFGIFDVIAMVLLAYDIMFFYYNIGSFIFNVMFYFSLVIAFVYLVMRFYIYLMMVTFDLSIRKLLKNALIFSVMGGVTAMVVMILLKAFFVPIEEPALPAAAECWNTRKITATVPSVF